MAQPLYKTVKSPRHGFSFSKVPTIRGSVWGGSIVRHYEESYASILDSVYEMTIDVADGNGVSVDAAMDRVLRDEQWRLLPTDKKNIRNRIADERIEAIFATEQ